MSVNMVKNITNEDIIVSVVIPILNEEEYIDKCILSILSQDYPKQNMEVLLVDGNSTDKTIEIINEYIKKYPFIKILKNPQKTVQYALNIGIKGAVGTYIVRLDAHAEYADDFISKCIEYLQKTDAVNVGGPMVAKGKTDIQKIIAAAYHSKFALGGGKFHIEDFEGYADTVFLGAFKRDFLLKLGLYDERLPRSEDDDLNFRIAEAGKKIYITPKIKSVYYPRSTYKSLFKQYFEYGEWKVAVIKKHKKPARISHIIPMLFVLYLFTFIIASFFSKMVFEVFSGILFVYIIINAYFSFTNKHICGLKNKLRLMYVHFLLHISYGFGFIKGIFKFINTKW